MVVSLLRNGDVEMRGRRGRERERYIQLVGLDYIQWKVLILLPHTHTHIIVSCYTLPDAHRDESVFLEMSVCVCV